MKLSLKPSHKRIVYGSAATLVGFGIANIDLRYATLVGVLTMMCGIPWAVAPPKPFPRRRVLFGVFNISVGVLVQLGPSLNFKLVGWGLFLHGLGWVGVPVWLYLRRYTSTTHQLIRWKDAKRRSDGTASWWAWRKAASPAAMRRQIRTLMPSVKETIPTRAWWNLFLAVRIWWLLRQIPLTRYSTCLAHDGKRAIYSPVEYVTGRVGGPRKGKTAEIASRVVDAPGAAIVTSTRFDIIELTEPMRRKVGPVYVFNPGGVGALASDIAWAPLIGCESPRVASDRSSDMIPKATTPEGERWDSQARGTLGVFFHAAALTKQPMRTVLRWVSDTRPETSGVEVHAALEESPECANMRLAAGQFFENNDRTRSSIATAMMPALRWLTDPIARKLGDEVGEDQLDVKKILDMKATVYLLGDDDGVTGPLIAAMTAEIARQARKWADRNGGRLDPALSLILDEAALICRVPLPRWTADMGGRNITIHWCVQSRAQLIEAWGPQGAATIINNTAVMLVFGGTKDPADLDAWSKVAGDKEVDVTTYDKDGKVTSKTTRTEPVFSPDTIARLPKLMALVLHADMPSVLGRVTPVWRRKDVREAAANSPYKRILDPNYEQDALSDDDDPEPGRVRRQPQPAGVGR